MFTSFPLVFVAQVRDIVDKYSIMLVKMILVKIASRLKSFTCYYII